MHKYIKYLSFLSIQGEDKPPPNGNSQNLRLELFQMLNHHFLFFHFVSLSLSLSLIRSSSLLLYSKHPRVSSDVLYMNSVWRIDWSHFARRRIRFEVCLGPKVKCFSFVFFSFVINDCRRRSTFCLRVKQQIGQIQWKIIKMRRWQRPSNQSQREKTTNR